jgi:DNA-binding protein
MKIKKNGKVISLTESDLQRIVKEQSKESLKMQGVDTGDDSIRNELTDLESRVSQIEKMIKTLKK